MGEGMWKRRQLLQQKKKKKKKESTSLLPQRGRSNGAGRRTRCRRECKCADCRRKMQARTHRCGKPLERQEGREPACRSSNHGTAYQRLRQQEEGEGGEKGALGEGMRKRRQLLQKKKKKKSTCWRV